MEVAFEKFLSSISSEGEFLFTHNDGFFKFASEGDMSYDNGGDILSGDDLLELFIPFVSEDFPIYVMEVDTSELFHTSCVVSQITNNGVAWFNVTNDFSKLFSN